MTHIKDVPLIKPENLILKNRGDLASILEANFIPIHPQVYKSRFAYSKKFIYEVRKKVPEALKYDLSVIDPILKKYDVKLTMTDKSIMHMHEFDEVEFYNDDMFSIEDNRFRIGTAVTHMTLMKDRPKELYLGKIDNNNSHPMLEEGLSDELAKYNFSDEEGVLRVYTWGSHDLPCRGLPFLLYSRNFAIVFNNLGIDRLEKKNK